MRWAGEAYNPYIIQLQAAWRLLCLWIPATLAVEGWSGAHHRARVAKRYGHEVIIAPAKFAATFRQGQKTDANDALAIACAARQPKLKSIAPKTVDQQDLRPCRRIFEQLSGQRTATSNIMRGLLAEFGLVFATKAFALKSAPFGLRDIYFVICAVKSRSRTPQANRESA